MGHKGSISAVCVPCPLFRGFLGDLEVKVQYIIERRGMVVVGDMAHRSWWVEAETAQ